MSSFIVVADDDADERPSSEPAAGTGAAAIPIIPAANVSPQQSEENQQDDQQEDPRRDDQGENNDGNSNDNKTHDPDRLSLEAQHAKLDEFHRSIRWHARQHPPPLGGSGPFIRSPYGRLKPWCCGLFVMHPGAPSAWAWKGCMIVFWTVVFCVWIVPDDETWSKVTACVLASFVFICLFGANCTDPGVILPKRVDEVEPREITVTIVHDADDPRRNETATLRVCETCKTLKPPHSAHEGQLGVHVLQGDHHCHVLSSTVAANTHRFFTMFMYFAFVFLMFILARTIAVLTTLDHLPGNDGERVWRLVASYLIIVITVMFGCCACGAGIHYTWMSCTDKTLRIMRKTREGETQCTHCSCVTFLCRLCGPFVPSQLTEENLRAGWIDEADGGTVKFV